MDLSDLRPFESGLLDPKSLDLSKLKDCESSEPKE